MRNKIIALMLLLTVFLPIFLNAIGVIQQNDVVLGVSAFGVYLVTPLAAIRLAIKK